MKTASLLTLLTALLLGAAMAFLKPAQPTQIKSAAISSTTTTNPAFLSDSMLLDNPSVPEDANIHPARKCGFCMG